jgi:hypothetical protein
MTSALRTFSIGEVENIHTQMRSPIAADIAGMRTPVVRNERELGLGFVGDEQNLRENTTDAWDMGWRIGSRSLRDSHMGDIN